MQKLISGIHKFQQEEVGKYQELFRRLSLEGQKPHTLFITCSDSRMLAELITQSQPGDLFVVKNIGNLIPSADVTGSTNSTAAAIEFAIQVLKVSDVVVCGHSQCGAMQALLDGLPLSKPMPHLSQWLNLAEPVKKLIERDYGHICTLDERTNAAAQENVLFALENLRSYNCVKESLADGTLRLHGWFFKIATAELFTYDPHIQQFQLIEPQA